MDDLDNFRLQWRSEIDDKKDEGLSAIEFWKRGSEFETDGDLSKAIECYRKAEYLDPNVYNKITDICRETGPEKQLGVPTFGGQFKRAEQVADVATVELSQSFQDLFINHPFLNQNHYISCYKGHANTTTLAEVPTEVIAQILECLVERNLDFVSVGRLGLTCKHLYKRSLDEKLWRTGCERIFGLAALPELITQHGSYRNIFLRTPKAGFQIISSFLVKR